MHKINNLFQSTKNKLYTPLIAVILLSSQICYSSPIPSSTENDYKQLAKQGNTDNQYTYVFICYGKRR
jgi:hypothetical protein